MAYKRMFSIVIMCMVVAVSSYGQDGGDIVYVKTKKLDQTYTGRFVQFDFYNKPGTPKNTPDTVALIVNDKPVQFVEHRADNGINNRFYQQYLECANFAGGYEIRLVKSRVDGVTKDSIQVTSYFDLYSKDNVLAGGKSIKQQYQLSKKMISRVLVKQEEKGI